MDRVVWIYWDQGLASAPDVVTKCVASWRHHNPDWTIRVLDRNSIVSYIDLHDAFDVDPDRVPQAAKSDLIRVLLLKEYGGVWSDATVLCAAPLNRWVMDATAPAGTFVLSNPAPHRLIASYFFSSVPGAPVISMLHDDIKRLWSPWPDRGVMTAAQTRQWLADEAPTGPVILHDRYYEEALPLPYFWMHFAYARLVATDPIFARHVQKIPKVDAGPSLLFARRGFLEPMTDQLRKAIEGGYAPLYKLDWRENALGPAVQYVIDEANWGFGIGDADSPN